MVAFGLLWDMARRRSNRRTGAAGVAQKLALDDASLPGANLRARARCLLSSLGDNSETGASTFGSSAFFFGLQFCF